MDKVLEYIEKGLDVALTPSAVAALVRRFCKCTVIST